MSVGTKRQDGNRELFSLNGILGDKLEDAYKNRKQITLAFSRGNNVTGIITNLDRQYAQAVIQTEKGEFIVRLGYIIQVFVKNSDTESFADYVKGKQQEKEEKTNDKTQ
jgi:hypothetical protein